MKQIRFQRFTVTGMVCILLMCVFLSSVSAAAATPTVTAAAVTAEKNGAVELTVSLEANPGLWGIRLEVGYDHEALTLQRADAGDIFTSEEITPPPDLTEEAYLFMADRTELSNTAKNGVLLKLTFAVKSGVELKDYPITLTVLDALDAEGNAVTLTCAAGKITVINCLHDGEKTVVNAKEATFKDEGYTGDSKCADCGVIIETGKVIPIIKCLHDKGTTVVDAKDATETEEGYTGDTKCNHCGKIIETGKVIPKLTPKPEESNPSRPDSPQTGDNSPMLLFVLMMCASGIVLVVIGKKRKVFRHLKK